SAHGSVVSLRCPHCRHVGAFPAVPDCNDIQWSRSLEPDKATIAQMHTGISYELWSAGMRRCPNPACYSLVFVVLLTGALYECHPPEVIDFDATNLPDRILDTLQEAVKAHAAGCYKASALMVRRVLEELCLDKNAKGKDLKARLSALAVNIVIPQDLR